MTLSGSFVNNVAVEYVGANNGALYLDGAVSGSGTWNITAASAGSDQWKNRLSIRSNSSTSTTTSGQFTVTSYGNLWFEGSYVNSTSAIYLNGANTRLRFYGLSNPTIRTGILTGTGTVDFSDAGGGSAITLSVGNDNGTGTFSGLISNSNGSKDLNVTKAGTGTWTVSGSNTYTGLTTISDGTLKLGATGDATNTPLGTTAAGTVVSTNGTLDLAGYTLGTAEY
ncbi:MAG: hypothetical protein EB048_12100 [Gammaproteobacteria bacterium]|nr:hypothetical protein [Gammaproteobacteria bacterium]